MNRPTKIDLNNALQEAKARCPKLEEWAALEHVRLLVAKTYFDFSNHDVLETPELPTVKE
jgi:hypothetical protein